MVSVLLIRGFTSLVRKTCAPMMDEDRYRHSKTRRRSFPCGERDEVQLGERPCVRYTSAISDKRPVTVKGNALYLFQAFQHYEGIILPSTRCISGAQAVLVWTMKRGLCSLYVHVTVFLPATHDHNI